MLTRMPKVGDVVEVHKPWHAHGSQATVIKHVCENYGGAPIVCIKFPDGHQQDFHIHYLVRVVVAVDDTPFQRSVREYIDAELR